MKLLFGFLFSFMIWPSIALADSPTDLDLFEKSEEIDTTLDTTSESRCFFDLTVISRQAFNGSKSANQWCSNIHKIFGIERSCFVRRHNDGRWFGDFRHQRRFYGESYDRIFRGYTQWSDRHLFRGFRFDHLTQFSPLCFGRGPGGGDYPIE